MNTPATVSLPAWTPRVGFFWFRKSPAHLWEVKEVTYDDDYYISDLDLDYLLTQCNTYPDATFEISVDPITPPAP